MKSTVLILITYSYDAGKEKDREALKEEGEFLL